MDSSIFKKASEYLGAKSKHRKWQIAVTALAALVVITTAYFLSKPAQTLVKDPNCGIEEHTHTEECYALELICGYDDVQTLPADAGQEDVQESAALETESSQTAAAESGTVPESQDTQAPASAETTAHEHDDSCYVEEQVLTCGQEEGASHTHTDACKTITEIRELTCGQEESAGHTHTDACKTITETRELTCGQEEGADHTHTDACYTVKQVESITCGQEESAGHTHTDACYTVSQVENITCGQEEGVVHTHTDACYETVRKLVCDKGAETDSQTPAGDDTADGSQAADQAQDAEAEVHVHTEECYRQILICKAEEHTHSDQCYQEVFCGITAHTHGNSCYDEEGELVCEIMEHQHTANCHKEPHCGITAHIHSADCYDEEGNPTCGMEEHIHVDECYITNTYFCAERIHTHSNDCYDLEGNLLCGSVDYWVHTHSETCYDKNERLICTLPEREAAAEGEEGALHTHTEECYGVRGVLICGQTEVLNHDHDDTCRIEPSEPWIDTTSLVAYCGMQAHHHKDSCKDSEGNVICGLEEHTHTEECFEEPGYGCINQIHVHEADCYDAEGNLQCGLADFVLHTHDAMCYGMNGELLCTLPEIAPHVHGPECYTQEAAPTESEEPAEDAQTTEEGEPVESQEAEPAMVLTCTLPEAEVHEHTDACRDENGKLICGRLQVAEHQHTEDCIIDAADIEIVQTFTGADFIVTATYNKKDADLPKDAQLFAERISEEGNEEYFAERAAQYEAMQGEEEDSTMQALMRIGFVFEGAEVEPKAPVIIKVQLLDENGMPEGSSVTVVHFGENGNERLEGTDAEKNSTTFQMNSFSEIALGWKKPIQTVEVDKVITYEDEAFTVTFHVEGEATLPTEEEIEEAKALENATVSDGDAEATVSGGDAAEASDEESQDTATGTEGEVTNEDLEGVVEPLGEDAEEYEAALGHATEADIQDEILSLQVLSYGLTYEGAKLDLTGCKVTVEVTPTDALVQFAENSEASVMAINDEEADEEQSQEETEVFVVAMDSEGTIFDTLTVSANASMVYETTAQGKDNEVTTYATSQANPHFSVQYYAEIKRLVEKHDTIKPLTAIDTSGKKLPWNGGNMEKKNIYVAPDGTVQTKEELTEIYSSGIYEYIKAPGLVYFNKIAKNKNYELKEINVLRSGGESWEVYNCENGREWHFTNKQATKDENASDFILITEGATIRLIYKVNEEIARSGANFYDYDVSDGKVYSYVYNETTKKGKLQETNRNNATTHDSGTDWYQYTYKQGINSMSGQTLGFGNSEGSLKSGLGNNAGNQANVLNKDYGKANFGMVTSLNSNGTIHYANDVIAPNLFNEDGGASGKTAYSGNLVFIQQGDTYTLTGAEVKENGKVVSKVENLQKLESQMEGWAPSGQKGYYFAANDFYPMDNVSSAGKRDLMFGSAASTLVTRNVGTKEAGRFYDSKDKKYYMSDSLKMPLSDDGENHNHYFGMYYTVNFDLTKDYVGPLEYLFYGDDDMWVFLNGSGTKERTDANGNVVKDANGEAIKDTISVNGELICDIGGVHSAVGEYVDLWDYIDKGTEGHYTLSFFYTERGASGSTCWMQFTLPSVSFATTKQDVGELRVEKQVTGNEDPNEEFGFTIKFYDAPKDSAGNVIKNPTPQQILDWQAQKDSDGVTDKNILKNDYSYSKYKKSQTEPIESDVLIWNNSKFTLKADEYIVISFLPDGSTYAIEEVGPVTVKPKEPGEDVNWDVNPENPYSPVITGGTKTETKGKIIGTISKNQQVEVMYNNMYQYELPKTGGTGTTTLYALACVLSALAGAGLVYRKKFRERRAQ